MLLLLLLLLIGVFGLLLGELLLFEEADTSTGEQGYALIIIPVVLILLVFEVTPSLLVLLGCFSDWIVFFVDADEGVTTY